MRRYGFAIVLMLLVAVPAWAQTTGSITGTVTDNTGALLPGVTVTATSPALMGSQTAVTNEQGVYRFPSLPPRHLRPEVPVDGLRHRQPRRHHRHHRLHRQRFPFSWRSRPSRKRVTVTGASPVVDVKNTNVQTNITQEMLKDIPNSRDIWTVIGQAPGFMVDELRRRRLARRHADGLFGVRLFGTGSCPGRRREHDRGHGRAPVSTTTTGPSRNFSSVLTATTPRPRSPAFSSTP